MPEDPTTAPTAIGSDTEFDSAVLDRILRGLDGFAEYAQVLAISLKRFELIFYPVLFSGTILVPYAFYLFFSLAKDTHYLAISLDSNGTVNASNLQSISEHFGQLTANIRGMAIASQSMARDVSALEPLLTSVENLERLAPMLVAPFGVQSLREELVRRLADPKGEADPAQLARALLKVSRAQNGEMSAWFTYEAAFLSDMLEVAGQDAAPVWLEISNSTDRFLAKKGARFARGDDPNGLAQAPLLLEFADVLSAYDCLRLAEDGNRRQEAEELRSKFREFLNEAAKGDGHGTEVSLLALESVSILGQVGKVHAAALPSTLTGPVAASGGPAVDSGPGNTGTDEATTRKQTLMMSSCLRTGRYAYAEPGAPAAPLAPAGEAATPAKD